MSTSDPLSALEDWVAPLLAKLEPRERRELARRIGVQLRRSQAARIASQRDPDGTPYAPRKAGKARAKKGGIRKSMFEKLRQAKHLRLQTDAAGATIGFLSRTRRIARVHQEGLLDSVQAGGPQHRYAARVLLGFTEGERVQIRDLLLAHLA